MHLTEDFPISSRLIRKTFRDEQKMNPNSARNIWKLLAQTRPEPDPKNPTRFQLCPTYAIVHNCKSIRPRENLVEQQSRKESMRLEW